MIEAIIIRLTPYRENDYIVNALSNDGFLTFRAVGAQKPNSSSASSLLLYSLVNVELRETKAGYTLTYIKPLLSSSLIFADYDKLAVLNVIGELILKTIKTEEEVKETFLFLKHALFALERATSPFSLLYLYLTGLLKRLGYGFNVNSCVKCGATTNIVGLDTVNGGLVCGTCAREPYMRLDEHTVNIVRYGFMFNETQFLRHEFSKEDVYSLLPVFLLYFEEVYNFRLSSKELL